MSEALGRRGEKLRQVFPSQPPQHYYYYYPRYGTCSFVELEARQFGWVGKYSTAVLTEYMNINFWNNIFFLTKCE